MSKGNWIGSVTTVMLMLCFWALPGFTMDITDKLSVSGVIAGVYQYQSVSDAPGSKDRGRGAVAFQPEVSIRPTKSDELFAKFGFAAGNGLNSISPFCLASWAADLEDDVKNINGRDRDYLLTAWYKHTFQFGEGHTLGITGGIIDATDYLDENRYACDEYTQFMNQALVNGPNVFLPSYDLGGAVEWEMGKLAIKGAIMGVGENDEGNSYQFYGVQVGYTLETPLGEGTYRVVVDATSDDFSDPDGRDKEPLRGIIISFDQALGEILGAWIRFGWSDDKAIVVFRDLYSGGIDISGKLWGREADNIGVGYAHLEGCNQDIDYTRVVEGYVRFQLTEVLAFTADLQYQKDNYKEGDGPDGFVYGARLTAEF
jgi:porin